MISANAKPYVSFPGEEQEGKPSKHIICDGGILLQNPAGKVRIYGAWNFFVPKTVS
jgi:hypothetical protein